MCCLRDSKSFYTELHHSKNFTNFNLYLLFQISARAHFLLGHVAIMLSAMTKSERLIVPLRQLGGIIPSTLDCLNFIVIRSMKLTAPQMPIFHTNGVETAVLMKRHF